MGAAWVVITAAGSSARMGGGIKKEYRLLGEKPVLAWSLDAFVSTRLFEGAVLTLPPGDAQRVRDLLRGRPDLNGFRLVFTDGGQTRQASVFNGLKACAVHSPGLVLIHDGARPWVSRELIRAVFNETSRSGACAPALPNPDALKFIDQHGRIQVHLDRARNLAIQTPQGFDFPGILAAHASAEHDGRAYVDDTEIFARYSGPVSTVAGDPRNRKITYPEDLGREGA